jgi:hypothetical protein
MGVAAVLMAVKIQVLSIKRGMVGDFSLALYDT